MGSAQSGRDKGSLAATFEWTDRQGNVVLTEDRVMTFYADLQLRIIDFDITFTSVQEVVWGDGKDGAFGIRLRPILDEQGGTGKMVNAEGLAGEQQLWGKPSDWCDYSGMIGDERYGSLSSTIPAIRGIRSAGTRAATAYLPPTRSACLYLPATGRRTALKRWPLAKLSVSDNG